MTDSLTSVADTAIARFERELLVRDFIDLLDIGCVDEMRPFLTDDAVFSTSPHRSVRGCPAVLAAVRDTRADFDAFRVSADCVAVVADTVLAHLRLEVAVRGHAPMEVLSFARFDLRDMQIARWTQIYA